MWEFYIKREFYKKKNKKKIYDIPIIIISDKGGVKYKIKCMKNIKDLKINKIYEVNYKLNKFIPENVWENILI